MMRNPSRTARAALIAGVAAFTFSAAPAFALTSQHDFRPKFDPAVNTGACQESGIAYSVSTDLQKTSSKNFVDVSGTSVSFSQKTAGCVEVSLTAEAATLPQQVLVTQASVDGSPCIPTDNNFASDSPSADTATHAMNYICTGIAAGNHTAKIQFRSRYGGKVAIDYRTTIVRFAR